MTAVHQTKWSGSIMSFVQHTTQQLSLPDDHLHVHKNNVHKTTGSQNNKCHQKPDSWYQAKIPYQHTYKHYYH